MPQIAVAMTETGTDRIRPNMIRMPTAAPTTRPMTAPIASTCLLGEFLPASNVCDLIQCHKPPPKAKAPCERHHDPEPNGGHDVQEYAFWLHIQYVGPLATIGNAEYHGATGEHEPCPTASRGAFDEFLKDSVRAYEAQLRREGSLTPENIRLRAQWIKRFIEFRSGRYSPGRHVVGGSRTPGRGRAPGRILDR